MCMTDEIQTDSCIVSLGRSTGCNALLCASNGIPIGLYGSRVRQYSHEEVEVRFEFLRHL